MEGPDLSAVEKQAHMDQFLSMFTQFVNQQRTNGILPTITPKYAQVKSIPREVTSALKDSHDDWQEIAIAEHLGETAFLSAEWIGFLP